MTDSPDEIFYEPPPLPPAEFSLMSPLREAVEVLGCYVKGVARVLAHPVVAEDGGWQIGMTMLADDVPGLLADSGVTAVADVLRRYAKAVGKVLDDSAVAGNRAWRAEMAAVEDEAKRLIAAHGPEGRG